MIKAKDIFEEIPDDSGKIYVLYQSGIFEGSQKNKDVLLETLDQLETIYAQNPSIENATFVTQYTLCAVEYLIEYHDYETATKLINNLDISQNWIGSFNLVMWSYLQLKLSIIYREWELGITYKGQLENYLENNQVARIHLGFVHQYLGEYFFNRRSMDEAKHQIQKALDTYSLNEFYPVKICECYLILHKIEIQNEIEPLENKYEIQARKIYEAHFDLPLMSKFSRYFKSHKKHQD